MKEQEIRHALAQQQADPDGRWLLHYSETGSQGYCSSNDFLELRQIFESALELQRARSCPWEWMTLTEDFSRTLFFDTVHSSFRRMRDGALVVVEV